MELTDTARNGWSSLQGKPFLRWVTNPALPVLAATILGALIGYAASLVGKLFRLDEENHANSSIAWGLTCLRRPRFAVWIGAFTLIPLLTVYVLSEAAGPLHWNLWMPLRSASNYQNYQIPYSIPSLPSGQMGAMDFNSNSWLSGLFRATTGSVPAFIFGKYQAPGYQNPVSSVVFRQ